MSLFKPVVKFFGGDDHKEERAELLKLFTYLRGLINREDLVREQFKLAQGLLEHPELDTDRLISVYSDIENFILLNKPIIIKRSFTKSELRNELRAHVNTTKLHPAFRITLLPEIDQTIYLYEQFLPFIEDYMINNLGTHHYLTFLSQIIHLPRFVGLRINNNRLYFEDWNQSVRQVMSIEYLTESFKILYSFMYDEIKRSFGDKIASNLFNKIYGALQKSYGIDITTVFLRVLPEKILELDEWLALLSKNELERRVKEKTDALQNLNQALESKVEERTKELKGLIEEQYKASKLLIRRDLELTRANDLLRELDERKSEFLSIVAHQLRTPLSGIKWTLNIMLSGDLGPLSEEQKSFLMKGYESNQRMIALVEDMLGADRVGSGRLKYSFTSEQLLDIIDNVIYELIPLAKKKNIKISFIDRKETLPKVSIDPDKIRGVLQNLIENAIKYTHPNGTIEISTKETNGMIETMIKDNGIGIPSAQQKNIFNRFFRAKNAVKIQTDGSGLGLFIANGIVERHGGKMWFESVEDKGSSFYFTLKIG